MRYFAKSNFQKQLDVFCKKGVLRNFEKLTGKQLCLQPLTIITKYSILDVAAVLGPPLGNVNDHDIIQCIHWVIFYCVF